MGITANITAGQARKIQKQTGLAYTEAWSPTRLPLTVKRDVEFDARTPDAIALVNDLLAKLVK